MCDQRTMTITEMQNSYIIAKVIGVIATLCVGTVSVVVVVVVIIIVVFRPSDNVLSNCIKII